MVFLFTAGVFLLGFVVAVVFLGKVTNELIDRTTHVARSEGYNHGWSEGYRAGGREAIKRFEQC
jgi:hypothetical protein